MCVRVGAPGDPAAAERGEHAEVQSAVAGAQRPDDRPRPRRDRQRRQQCGRPHRPRRYEGGDGGGGGMLARTARSVVRSGAHAAQLSDAPEPVLGIPVCRVLLVTKRRDS